MEYVARLFIEGGGFQGIANAHNAALEPAKAETEAASRLVLNSHGSRLTAQEGQQSRLNGTGRRVG
jgi:hypothetical protein